MFRWVPPLFENSGWELKTTPSCVTPGGSSSCWVFEPYAEYTSPTHYLSLAQGCLRWAIVQELPTRAGLRLPTRNMKFTY